MDMDMDRRSRKAAWCKLQSVEFVVTLEEMKTYQQSKVLQNLLASKTTPSVGARLGPSQAACALLRVVCERAGGIL